MTNPFITKLYGFAPLTTEDVSLLETACGTTRKFPARHDLIREGDKPGPLFVMLEGWACRYKVLPGGGRQIVAFMLPGDFCDMHVSLLDEMDHSVATITPALVAMIPRAEIEKLVDTRPAITRALWYTQLVDEAVLRAWIVSMGRRDSVERVAHLMCELYIRACNIGLAEDDHVNLPLTQIVLSDALGLTPVHVNQVLSRLRADQVMDISGGMLTIADPGKLAVIAGFNDTYLHQRLRRTGLRATYAAVDLSGRLAGVS